ncbi:hypothetical protein DBR39_24150 [Chryseobacterium sp. KBW03]|nr:hypothetical protein DBR39_24150 [Chryseobacterium sp. KBW03]
MTEICFMIVFYNDNYTDNNILFKEYFIIKKAPVLMLKNRVNHLAINASKSIHRLVSNSIYISSK